MTIQPMPGAVPPITLKTRLRVAREFANFEQSDLATAAGLSRATISAAENGHKKPARSTIQV